MTTKTLKYKTAEFHNDTTNRTLQSLVQSALTKLKAAAKRRNLVDAGSGTVRLINYHSPYKSMRVGELLIIRKGMSSRLLGLMKTPRLYPSVPLVRPMSNPNLSTACSFSESCKTMFSFHNR